MNTKQNKGISLIILVITVIVMIILASVIILSLDGSDIIGKANEAKTASDLASKKEAAALKLIEYELKIRRREIDSSITANQYVKDELEKNRIDTSDIAIADNGEILVGVAALFINNNVKIGTEIKGYDLTSNTKTSYKTSGNEFTNSSNVGTAQTIERASTLVWKYMGIDEKGNALIVADSTAKLSKVKIGGKGAYLNGAETLNNICENLYSSDMGTARSIDFDDVIRVLEYDGPLGQYGANSGDKRTAQPLTVEQIAKLLGTTVEVGLYYGTETPDGTNISTYKSNGIGIFKTSEHIKGGDEAKKLIFQETIYWLASPGVYVGFGELGKACFGIGHVSYLSCSNYGAGFESSGEYFNSDYMVRPVVALSSELNISYNGTTVTLSK